ncbi:MAG: hypothetical protein ACK4P3_00190 [Fimbriimonadaceae bacterium]
MSRIRNIKGVVVIGALAVATVFASAQSQTVIVTPESMNGWQQFTWSPNGQTIASSKVGEFQNFPNFGSGTGAAWIVANFGDGIAQFQYNLPGTRTLANLQHLTYWTYTPQMPAGTNDSAPVLILRIASQGDTDVDVTLQYEPRNNGAVDLNVWRESNAATGQWTQWFDNTNTLRTLSGWINHLNMPNARVISVNVQYGTPEQSQIFSFNAAPVGFDMLRIAFPSWDRTFDFERFAANPNSTIFWQGPDTGPLPRLLVAWRTDLGVVTMPSILIDVTPPGWDVETVGNVVATGPSGLVFQRTENPQVGLTGFWTLDENGVPFPAGSVGAPPSANWRVKALCDVNGDGVADLIWYNPSNRNMVIWFRDQFNQVLGTILIAVLPAGFEVVGAVTSESGIGANIYVQNPATGVFAYYRTNSFGNIFQTMYPPTPGADWRVVGIGQLYNNFTTILFRNQTTNLLAAWNMNSQAQVVSTNIIAEAPAEWRVLGMGRL